MNKYYLLAGLLMAGSLTACGDDGTASGEDSGNTQTDAGDTSTDSGTADTSDNEVIDETCGDGTIGTGEVCDGSELGGATCSDAGDFTGGSLTCNAACDSFDTSACTSMQMGCDNCSADQSCVDDMCIDNVTPEAYVFDEPLSYIGRMQLPAENNPCCFDYTGDGVVDNGLGQLLNSLGSFTGGLDLQAQLDSAIEDGSVAMMLEFHDIPTDLSAGGDAAFSIWLVSNDVDGDGTPDQDLSTRQAGDGVFQVNRDSFGDAGSVIQFRRGDVTNGVIDAGPSVFNLSIPIPGFINADLQVLDAQIQGPIVNTANGIASVNSDADVDGETVEFGGAMLGGVIPLEQLLEIFDTLMVNDCGVCAQIDTSIPFFTFGEDEDEGNYFATCGDYDASGCTDDDGTLCTNLDTICGIGASLLIASADVDTNSNDIKDAYSIGMYLSLAGATLADPAVQP